MSIVNKKVKHEKYGEGIIDGLSNGTFHVAYQNGKSIFYDYPNDIEYLTLLDVDEQTLKEIQNDIDVQNGRLLVNNINGTRRLGLNDTKKIQPIGVNLGALTQLNHGDCFVETAKEIYESLCNNSNFNFDLSQKGKFGMMQLLYAKNATPEGYSVWFIPYSSYTQTVAAHRGIYNNIEEVSNNIVEYWLGETEFDCSDTTGEKIVTFVKNNFKQYEFWGVMETVDVDATKKIVTQKYISERYPNNK